MTDTEAALLTAARVAIDELGLWADTHLELPLRPHERRAALKSWRLAKETLSHAVRWCEADDPETCTAEVYAEVVDLAEAIGACECALRFGSAAPAPVAVVAVEAALAMACDLCGTDRKTHRAVPVARLADDTTETADVCFLCHREGQRGRTWDHETRSYVDANARAAALQAAEERRQLEWLRAHPDLSPADLANLDAIPF